MKKIFNSVISSEQIPSYMKVSLIKPIYKGKGKNPLLPNSYRGISLSSTMGKALEYILLDRMRPVLQQNGSPHLLQTAYQQGVSCEDAVFATQEAALRVLREGGKAFLAFFDLEKAFDTIEFPVLLKCLFNAGVCGKAWRVIRSWYTDAKAAVEVDGLVSNLFPLGRGVRQGSVLSPTLFLIVMDGMLHIHCWAIPWLCGSC